MEERRTGTAHIFTVLQRYLPSLKIATSSKTYIKVYIGAPLDLDKSPDSVGVVGLFIEDHERQALWGAARRFTPLYYYGRSIDKAAVYISLNALLFELAAAWHKDNPSEVK